MTAQRKDPHRYDDIIHLPHHVSATHPHMTLYDRAAQFMPFRALTGYEDDVSETARLTDARIDLDESSIEQLDARLQLLGLHLHETPDVSITYFRADERKSGGAYLTVTGSVKRIDMIEHVIIMRNGEHIKINDIYAIEGELFTSLDG